MLAIYDGDHRMVVASTDASHSVLGIPYAYTNTAFAMILAIVFVVWYRSDGTLSIHSIHTGRREFFFIAVRFAIPLIGDRYWGRNEIFSFGFTHVVTRQLGASFADWFGITPYVGGLGINRASLSLVPTLVIAAFVAYLSIRGSDIQGEVAAV